MTDQDIIIIKAFLAIIVGNTSDNIWVKASMGICYVVYAVDLVMGLL
jgi:hypothetical protein